MQQMAAEFTAVNQIDVELMFVSPLLLPNLVNTAVLSNTLPDIIIHPLEYTAGWAERGVLNADAAETAVNQIGRDTFDPEPKFVGLVDTGQWVSRVPVKPLFSIGIRPEDYPLSQHVKVVEA